MPHVITFNSTHMRSIHNRSRALLRNCVNLSDAISNKKDAYTHTKIFGFFPFEMGEKRLVQIKIAGESPISFSFLREGHNFGWKLLFLFKISHFDFILSFFLELLDLNSRVCKCNNKKANLKLRARKKRKVSCIPDHRHL